MKIAAKQHRDRPRPLWSRAAFSLTGGEREIGRAPRIAVPMSFSRKYTIKPTEELQYAGSA